MALLGLTGSDLFDDGQFDALVDSFLIRNGLWN